MMDGDLMIDYMYVNGRYGMDFGGLCFGYPGVGMCCWFTAWQGI